MKKLIPAVLAMLLLCSCGKHAEISPYTVEDGHYTCTPEELTEYVNSRIDDDGGEVAYCDFTESCDDGALRYSVFTDADGYLTKIRMNCCDTSAEEQWQAYASYIIDAVDAAQHEEINKAVRSGASKIEAVATYIVVDGSFTAEAP